MPDELAAAGVMFVRGNPTNEDVLYKANLPQASHVVVLTRDVGDPHCDDTNLTILLMMENLNSKVFSIAQVIDPKKVRQFKVAGCDSVLCTSAISNNLLIQELQDPGVKDVIEQLSTNEVGQQVYLTTLKSKGDVSYRELAIWGIDNGYSVIGVVRDGAVQLNCKADESVSANDRIAVIGKSRPSRIQL